MHDYLNAILLGIVEGLTEFLPVSSTGHLILAEQFFGGLHTPGKLFEIVIQLGAILAVCVLYWRKLWQTIRFLPQYRQAQIFTANIMIAFLPAGIAGVLLAHFITQYLFSPLTVALALIIGGIAIIVIEKQFDPVDRMPTVDDITPGTAFKIGLFQILAMIPGTSRSGATIIGGTLLGLSRRAAAEFSFFLAIPTMLGASAYTIYKARHEISFAGFNLIAVGFITAFIVALMVVKVLIGFIQKHGFTPFGWYRIVLGAAILLWLSVTTPPVSPATQTPLPDAPLPHAAAPAITK